MNTGNKDLRSVDSSYDGADQIAQLLGRVDPRPPLPDERKERVKDAVHDQWKRSLRGRRRRRMVVASGSLAAILALVIFMTPAVRERISAYMEPPYRGPVADVAVVHGLVWYAPEDTPEQYPGRRLTAEEVVESGSRIATTAASRAALKLLDGRSVRLDHGTQIRLLTPTTLELHRGALYIDSELGSENAESVQIFTALGSVYDIGTQFEVRFSDEALRVRVREGLINLDRSGEAEEAAAGVELLVNSRGELLRGTVQTHGPIWDWILEIAPSYALEGSSLPSFLAWVSRETGRKIEFADPATATSVAGITVHGSIEGMRPDAALEAVLPTCGLVHRVGEGAWILESRRQ